MPGPAASHAAVVELQTAVSLFHSHTGFVCWGLAAVLLRALLVLLPPTAGGAAGRLAGACCSRRHAKVVKWSLEKTVLVSLPLGRLHPADTTVKSSRAAKHLIATTLA